MYRAGAQSMHLFLILSNEYFMYFTLYRYQGHRNELDGKHSKFPHTRKFMEELIDHYTVNGLWDDFGIVSDIIVCPINHPFIISSLTIS